MSFLFPSIWLVFLAEAGGMMGFVPNEEDRLLQRLLINYTKLARPAQTPLDITQVEFKFVVTKILALIETKQVIRLNGLASAAIYIIMEDVPFVSDSCMPFGDTSKERPGLCWHDPKFMWDPGLYNGITMVHVPSELIWVPDIILYNNADGNPGVETNNKAHIDYAGFVHWEPAVIYEAMCPIQIEWFPFDTQDCELKFGSWTYYGSELNLIHNVRDRVVEQFIGEEKVWIVEYFNESVVFKESGEWDLMTMTGVRHSKRYSCCQYPFVDITYYIQIRRKPLFYAVTLITPCVALAALSCSVCCLPADSRSKMMLCISVFVSCTVYILLLNDLIPPTSLATPLIAKYLVFTMVCSFVSIATSVCTINIHYSSILHPMPSWIRMVFLRFLPRVLFLSMRRYEKETQVPISLLMLSSTLINPFHRRLGVWRLEDSKTIKDTHMGTLRFFLASPVDKKIPEKLKEAIRRACVNITYLANNLRQKEEEKTLRDDWKFVALVIDRAMIMILCLTILCGSCVMLLSAPSLWDSRQPLTDKVNKDILMKWQP